MHILCEVPARLARILHKNGHFTSTFLGRQLQDFYWDLNLCALKKFSARKIFICCIDLYVYMQLDLSSPVMQRGKLVWYATGQTSPVA